ncbi:MAG: FMN-binding protein [Bacteroidales bacterium]|nr:FMN-binding protein [Bacteroidales bacterium]
MKKTFSNRYIFIYSAVLVVVAALILTVVAVSLKPAQEKNQQAETKQMILKTIGIDATRDNAAELYAQNIQEADLKGEPYFTFKGGVIIPLRGTGLWGPIWGYLAFDDGGTVVGAVFDHKGETPGLGGEISTDKFAQRFVGKEMCEEPIRLKKNADKDNPYEVDAISGGTMTSNGVTAMLATAYEKYSDVIPCHEDCEAISALMMEEEEQ